MPETLVADTETDGLLDTVTKLHMIQLGTLAGEDVTIYCDSAGAGEIERAREGVMLGKKDPVPLTLTCPIRPLREGLERLEAAEMSYWHNGLSYDLEIIERFGGGVLKRSKMRDTMVMARLLTREFDNRLEAWGRRLGCHKGDFNGPYDTVTAEFLAYSQQDIPAGRALVRHLLKLLPGGEQALETEQAVAYWISRQERTGFHLNEPEAVKLHIELQGAKRDMERQMRATFPSRWIKVGDYIPKVNSPKFGYTKGVPLTRIEWEEFTPTNRQMFVRRLMDRGWKPTTFSAGGAPKLDEDVLGSLAKRFPEAAVLARYLDVQKQADFVGQWLAAARDGKVHGRVNSIGAYTQRMSHQKPNMAQIPKTGPYRSLWLPRPGWTLVGCDGAAIQARVLAHYLHSWDGGKFGRIISEGRSEDQSDIHSLNVKACDRLFPAEMSFKHRRDTMKNCFYAIFFGAQDPRLGQTVKDGCMGYAKLRPPSVPNRELGAAVRRGLEVNLGGLSQCTKLVEETFERRKFLMGLDGRKLFPPSKRNALVTIIQAGEAVIMKAALVDFADRVMPAAGWEYDRDWAFVANVHDEVQIEARSEIAKTVGECFADSIRIAAAALGCKVPFAGEAKTGANWAETH